ncbi:hypothetical protein [Roseibium sp. M-1]
MFAKISKISAPIAGAILLVSAGLVTTASAAPQAGKLQVQTPQAELVVKVGQRHGHGRNGWQGGHGWHQQQMGPRQIRRSLRHRGFHDINILDRRGPMFIVKARGWQGFPMRLVVDSRNAQIVRMQPMGHRRHGHNRWN